MNRALINTCYRIVINTPYSRPLFTSKLFEASRFERLRVTAGCRNVFEFDHAQRRNQRLCRIDNYSTSQSSKEEMREKYEKYNISSGELNYSSDKTPSEGNETVLDPKKSQKLTLFQRFKAMYRDYWYVLIPVHVATSIGWFVGFYYVAKSGIDLVSIAEKIHLSESLTNKFRNGGHNVTGYLAIAYALFKIVTPLRYTVTLGGTTLSINYLRRWGWIKPIPKKSDIQKMYNNRKESLKDRKNEMKAYINDKLKKNP